MINKNVSAINSPVRQIKSKVELLNSSTLANIRGDSIALNNLVATEYVESCSIERQNLLPLKNISTVLNGNSFVDEIGEDYVIARGSEGAETGSSAWSSGWIRWEDLDLQAGEIYSISYDIEFIEQVAEFEFPQWHRVFIGNTSGSPLTRQYTVKSMGAHQIHQTYTFPDSIAQLTLSLNSCKCKISNFMLVKGSYTAVTMPAYTRYIDDLSAVKVVKTSTDASIEPVEYSSNAAGAVKGVAFNYPSTILNTNPAGAVINLEYHAAAVANTFTEQDAIKSFTITRTGEGKFFGYGICQKLSLKLVDKERSIAISAHTPLKVALNADSGYINFAPIFYVASPRRDENTNELSITAYDELYELQEHTVAELGLGSSYTIKDFAIACANFIGTGLSILNVNDTAFDTYYENGANFEGTETIRAALDAIAEATQTIYYLSCNGCLVFKRLDRDGQPVTTLTKEDYITLKSGDNRRLATICSATELGDNVSFSTPAAGSTQYVRDNPFWELRDDISSLVDAAVGVIGGLTINQFECNWRGNFLLEIGDKIALTTKDDNEVITYFLDDTLEYNGALAQKTQWSYMEIEAESAYNPTTLGEALKLTYARVDKANKQIELVASETSENSTSISALRQTTNNISASVTRVENRTDNITKQVTELTKKAELAVTEEQVTIAIQQELSDGVDKVTTTTGFTFNDEGLTIDKTDSEISTKITEDGMRIT